jgi:DNA-binding NarL/FixJ family response regulator
VIAAALVMSVRTVGVQVQHAIAKVGAHSRQQVADWGREHGLTDGEAGCAPPVTAVRPT